MTLRPFTPADSTATLEHGSSHRPVAGTLTVPGTVYTVGVDLAGGWATSFGLGRQGRASVDARLQRLGDRLADGFFARARASPAAARQLRVFPDNAVFGVFLPPCGLQAAFSCAEALNRGSQRKDFTTPISYTPVSPLTWSLMP